MPCRGGETHEVIRLPAGTALENAYVCFEDGAWHGLNVNLTAGPRGTMIVLPTDKRIRRLYINTTGAAPVQSLRCRTGRNVERILHPVLN